MSEQALSSQPFGYKKKPWRVYAVALYLLIAPWVFFVLAIKFNINDPGWYKPSVLLHYLQVSPPRLVLLLGLTLASGSLLLFVRKASWVVAVVTLVLVILYNVFFFNFQIPWSAVVLLLFVLFTPFRKPYLNPSLRWWEQPPRFEVDLFADIPETQSKIHVYDISEGGLLGEYLGLEKPEIEDKFYIEFENGPKLLSQVVRKQEGKYVGVHFEDVNKIQFKRLKKFIRRLRRRGAAVSKR